jgi:hypothetical protein
MCWTNGHRFALVSKLGLGGWFPAKKCTLWMSDVRLHRTYIWRAPWPFP